MLVTRWWRKLAEKDGLDKGIITLLKGCLICLAIVAAKGILVREEIKQLTRDIKRQKSKEQLQGITNGRGS